MISYANVPLLDASAELISWIEHYSSPQHVREFERLTSLPINQAGDTNFHSPLEAYPRPFQLNTLFWPRGAARWAYGHFLVTDEQLAQIRVQVYGANLYLPQPLTITDGTNWLTTMMFMLPPRPLAQNPPVQVYERQLHLLTLVDDRYNWWEKAANIAKAGSWEEFYANISTALGVAINVDLIHNAYQNPPDDAGPNIPAIDDLTAQNAYLPLLLDSVADAVGQKIVRKLDGTVVAMSAETAIGTVTANVLGKRKEAGGMFNFGALALTDLNALVPEQVTVSFPKQLKFKQTLTKDDGEQKFFTTYCYLKRRYTATVTLTSLGLPTFGAAHGKIGQQHPINSTALGRCEAEEQLTCETDESWDGTWDDSWGDSWGTGAPAPQDIMAVQDNCTPQNAAVLNEIGRAHV